MKKVEHYQPSLNAKRCTLYAGFSLVEALFYVAIFSFSLLAIMQTLIVVTRSHGMLRSAQRVEQEASISIERMIREIRDGESIDDAGSVFSAHPGKLLLHSTNVSGLPRTVEFSLSGGKLSLKEDGVAVGLLTSTQTNISNLVFRKISTARSEGVKIEMTMQSGTSTTARSENFNTTAALRDSY
ncbi:MAG TPA: hypothetical protein DEF00_04145 [Candidatus Taylorbacteria bacterium]|nr:MAG: hypothetical protein UY03_C0022G0002 [Parcubacteria group bacterium GW2011_GWA2_47_64]KKU96642.1 MAG: hypothetical protein UY29_C0009G0056 [Parcubacteria group bacterium GW2011_GWC2_48_17]HBV01547.1 hypothetical protein [Candidatus Taylorbacteria bacterium]